MNTLAFDTCFGACSVAVTGRVEGGWPGAFRYDALVRGHAERLLPMIGEAMAEAPFGFSSLERIVVTDGPGTFTGQRVGIAAARALALSTGASVHVLSSLQVMAYVASHALGEVGEGRTIAVAVDARRGEIYFQAFAGSLLAPLGPPVLVTPADAVSLLGSGSVTAVGSGAPALADAARQAGFAVSSELPGLEPDVRFIPPDAPLGAPVVPRPLYLRPPDAKPQDGAILVRPS
jgi:tRNA threonylcarbamoyladenosine biosynthesis protein TsaB